MVQQGKPVYDPTVGEHIEKDKVKEIIPCNVNHLGMDRSVQLFGDFSVEVYVVRLDYKPNIRYDYVIYEGEKFKVVKEQLRSNVIYISRDDYAKS